jgi:hypothetical protein
VSPREPIEIAIPATPAARPNASETDWDPVGVMDRPRAGLNPSAVVGIGYASRCPVVNEEPVNYVALRLCGATVSPNVFAFWVSRPLAGSVAAENTTRTARGASAGVTLSQWRRAKLAMLLIRLACFGFVPGALAESLAPDGMC